MTALRPRDALKRVLVVLFGLFTAWMLLGYARRVHWSEVAAALGDYRPSTLALAMLLAAVSYGFYCSYDLAARRYTGHALSTRRVALITFVTYAVSLNLGALIGGAGFRFNLYSRAGLRSATIGRIVGFGISTNWLGYGVLLGGLLVSGRVTFPTDWPVDAARLQVVGALLLALALGYLAACWRWHDRTWHVRGHAIVLPTLRLALVQVLLSACNWLVIAGIVFVLMERAPTYAVTLTALLLSGIAGALVHVPAGIGVLEAVFVSMLGPQLGEPRVLAALIAYRAVYYLLPLALAALAYFGLHLGDRRGRPRPEPVPG